MITEAEIEKEANIDDGRQLDEDGNYAEPDEPTPYNPINEPIRRLTTESKMELKTNTDRLRQFVKGITSQMEKRDDEAVIRVNENGVSVFRLSASNASLVKAFMPNREFSRYAVKEATYLGVDIRQLDKLLSQIFKAKDAQVEIREYSTKLQLTMYQENGGRKVLSVPIIDVKSEEKEPLINYSVNLDMDAEEFKNALKDATYVSRFATLTAYNRGELNISAMGDNGEYNETYERGEKITSMFVSGMEQRSTYNLELLAGITKVLTKGMKLKLRFGYGQPLNVSFNIDGINYAYTIAPYMEDADAPTQEASGQEQEEPEEEEQEEKPKPKKRGGRAKKKQETEEEILARMAS